MAKNRANKRKQAGKLTKNQQRKATYATQAGWKHGTKGSRKRKGVRLVGGKRTKRTFKPTDCPRSCKQCYPDGHFVGACPRGAY